MTSVQFDKSSLTPEQGRAVRVLEQHFQKWRSGSRKDLKLEEITTMNYYTFTNTPLHTSMLPRGESWSWNQSRARATVRANFSDITATFYKLSTRKTSKSESKPPLYKLWIYDISIPHLNGISNEVYFLWCEKGKEPMQPQQSYKPVKQEGDSSKGRLSSVRGAKPSFTPKFAPKIPSATATTPPPAPVKAEKKSPKDKRKQQHQQKRRQKNQHQRKPRDRAPAPLPIPKRDSTVPTQSEKPVIVPENDRFDESGEPGTYPVSLPLLQPDEFTQNNENLGQFLSTADADTLMFVQLPAVLPITKESETEPIPVRDLPSGYLGKLMVYRSGKVKMKIGDILFDVSIGTKSTCLQHVAHISTKDKTAMILGTIKQRTVVTPNIEDLLNNSFSDEEDYSMED